MDEKNINRLYDEKKYNQLILMVANKYPDLRSVSPELLKKVICSYCKQHRYGPAMEMIIALKEYGHEFPTIRTLIIDRIQESINAATDVLDFGGNSDPEICNAFIIAALNAQYPELYKDQALRCVKAFESSKDIFAIHMQYNMGRLYLALNYPETAIDYWLGARERYGEDNIHHQANLMFWVHKAYLQLGEKKLALTAAEHSRSLWLRAIEDNPNNEAFLQCLNDIQEICEKLKT